MIDNQRRDEWEVGEIMNSGEGDVRNWCKVLCIKPETAIGIAEYHAECLLFSEPDEDGCECYVAVKINDRQWLRYRIRRKILWKYITEVLEEPP